MVATAASPRAPAFSSLSSTGGRLPVLIFTPLSAGEMLAPDSDGPVRGPASRNHARGTRVLGIGRLLDGGGTWHGRVTPRRIRRNRLEGGDQGADADERYQHREQDPDKRHSVLPDRCTPAVRPERAESRSVTLVLSSAGRAGLVGPLGSHGAVAATLSAPQATRTSSPASPVLGGCRPPRQHTVATLQKGPAGRPAMPPPIPRSRIAPPASPPDHVVAAGAQCPHRSRIVGGVPLAAHAARVR
jgi:hypothetical protein